jgi:hypothetical protein
MLLARVPGRGGLRGRARLRLALRTLRPATALLGRPRAHHLTLLLLRPARGLVVGALLRGVLLVRLPARLGLLLREGALLLLGRRALAAVVPRLFLTARAAALAARAVIRASRNPLAGRVLGASLMSRLRRRVAHARAALLSPLLPRGFARRAPRILKDPGVRARLGLAPLVPELQLLALPILGDGRDAEPAREVAG